MKKVKENREAFPTTKKAGMYKLGIRKGKIIIEFGKEARNDEVNVISSVWMEPSRLLQFILACTSAGIEYQKKYEQDIGFTKFIKSIEERKESKEEV